MKTFELQPENRKSFYGKAKVLQTPEGNLYLKSYDTNVATYTKDKTFEVAKDESLLTNTTLRHITAFRLYLGLPKLTKKQLIEL